MKLGNTPLLLAVPALLKEGSLVEVRKNFNLTWLPARISEARLDGLFDVLFDSGLFEKGVSERRIRFGNRDFVGISRTVLRLLDHGAYINAMDKVSNHRDYPW
jgi:hypothetical protein